VTFVKSQVLILFTDDESKVHIVVDAQILGLVIHRCNKGVHFFEIED